MLAVLVLVFQAVSCGLAETDAGAESLFKIEGKIVIQGAKIEEWSHQTRILVNGGEFVGFVRSDGMFTVSNVPPGSHLVEVSSPNYMFEMARVEISSKSKGKMRARKVDNVQPSKVDAIPYPLRLKTKGRAEYFEKREEWRLKDALANPMMLMMVLPLILLVVLPRLTSNLDQENKETMTQMQSMFNQRPSDMFDMSAWLQRIFSGGSSKRSSASKSSKKAITSKRK
ncbi:ER membrane protein complex subunit 7-like [Corticium candelabrum]|uniref:ER membrane protein complex subunit 7-like n=1 Tax=Corticium candelabrum TaxID=121492 RepID=UPI002E27689B|nr:ER membrane protein complex subunit 7-like [Corticium candelabrum]